MHTDSARFDVDPSLGHLVNDAIARVIASIGLVGIALIHVLQLPEAFSAAGYLGALFIGAIVTSLVLSAAIAQLNDLRVWGAAGGLAALILLGYVVSRTAGLPSFTDDVGEWSEPLGLASMVAEGLLICLAGGALATSLRATGSTAARPIETRLVAGG